MSDTCSACGKPVPYGQAVQQTNPTAIFDQDCWDRLYVGGPIAYVLRPVPATSEDNA